MKKIIFCLFMQFLCLPALAGLQLETTRVIYSSASSSGTLTLNNTTTQNYMLQTWLETADKKQSKSIPIQVVPPIMRIDAGKNATLRFIYSGRGLPDDRESLFWINTQEIPPASDKQNVLQIAVHSRLKLFYRPKTLNTTLEDEVEKLNWSLHGNKLSVTNNGPMYISLNKLHTGSSLSERSDIEIDMIAPHSTQEFNLPTSARLSGNISFNYVNDYGGTTEVADIPLK